ncbi:NADP-dependent oxidoreductase [Mycobacterium avium]|uniref:NADP-dependent oxidoreductase n=1 Tax=Mycobacterium avium TaxID=1764 RepID=UPI001CC58D7B|nr:NADP-dependent oxidoreductase [Mycobacterium avium]MBZ4521870.1 NADP-dependent oxidoreductase [Mycobacterium avium subsp. hominissuis]MBZ4531253.1 NADP-dependent oxidoreductase [Mycobacterium avium subsp. hominissuis]
MVKRLQYDRYGGPETMYVGDATLPPVGKKKIRVRVKASSINEIDWRIRQGYLKIITGRKFPRGMGMEFSGVVAEAGSGQPFEVGDEVFGGLPIKIQGGFGEELVTNANIVAKKPETVSFEAAATLSVVGGTAWQALVKYGTLQKGDNLFVNGAYGALGQSAVQIARALGADRIVARVSRDDFDAVKAIGANEAISYHDPIPPELEHSFDIVLDAHGGLAPKDQSFLVANGGRILDVNPDMKKRLLALKPNRKAVFGSLKTPVLDKVMALAANGELTISIGRRVNLGEAAKAIAELERGDRVKGKTIILP